MSTQQIVGRYTETRMLPRVEQGFAVLERFPAAVIYLMARVAIAAVFFKSGLTKIASWEFTVLLFRDEYKVPVLSPELAAMMATAAELSIPVFLALGLATRLATLPLLAMTAVIQIFVYPENWAEHLMWATILVLLLTRGPGAISLDHLIAARLGGR